MFGGADCLLFFVSKPLTSPIRKLAEAVISVVNDSLKLWNGFFIRLKSLRSVSARPALETVDTMANLAPADIPNLPAPVVSNTLKQGAPTILTVDDEPINLQVLENLLLPQGFKAIKAQSGPEALRSVASHRPDLIILDVMMPIMSGLEVAQKLRRRYSLHELPILLLTARSRSSDMIAGFDAGANDYVVKPFVKDELLSRCGTLLQASRAYKSNQENLELREEIERRIQIEDALRLSQRRMTQLLDTLEDGLICVNASEQVTYANAHARQFLATSVHLNQSLLRDLLPQEACQQISLLDAGDIPQQLTLELEGRTAACSVFSMMPEAGGGKAILLSLAGSHTDDYVHSLRDMVDSSLPTLIAAEPQQPPAAVIRDTYRETIVALMTGTLDLWIDLTGKNKIEFAETSGLWRVNLDKTSLQTRTLDKYLLLDTLPAEPALA